MQTTRILPTQTEDLFLTDGGLETTLIFLEGMDLPFFAAFDVLKDAPGYNKLKDYYRKYLEIAKEYGTSFILESATWRANPDWLTKAGYKEEDIYAINKKAIQLLAELRNEYDGLLSHILISGCVGPRGDGYRPASRMSIEEAEAYHSKQVEVFSRTTVDMVSAITMNYAEEASGIGRAANTFNLPCVISFTVETDGKLITGMELKDAIDFVDNHVTKPPLYYMINCAHPLHFRTMLEKIKKEAWTRRIKGIRANASHKSHAELDESTSLDRGQPAELAKEYSRLRRLFGHLNVFGGCCGTDEEHVREMARELVGEEKAVGSTQ